jgi:hypothetical protein
MGAPTQAASGRAHQLKPRMQTQVEVRVVRTTPVCQFPTVTSLNLAHCLCKVFAVCLNETMFQVKWVGRGRRWRHGGVSPARPRADAHGRRRLQRPCVRQPSMMRRFCHCFFSRCCGWPAASVAPMCPRSMSNVPRVLRDEGSSTRGALSRCKSGTVPEPSSSVTADVNVDVKGGKLQYE